MNKSYEEGSIEWESFGKVQEYIRDQIRKDERDNLLPTFQEFADFIAEEWDYTQNFIQVADKICFN